MAVSLLGVRLFLAGSPAACADSGAACCCAGSSADAREGQEESGCGCTVSPAVPVPVAVLASAGGVTPPVLLAEAAEARAVEGPRAVPAVTRTLPAARSAPTQALLETFRN
ncbi:MAG: hypothetical protein IPF66_07215 [Holophagales bacterium]|nr:hypothetical protein [Holophagales bacterium]